MVLRDESSEVETAASTGVLDMRVVEMSAVVVTRNVGEMQCDAGLMRETWWAQSGRVRAIGVDMGVQGGHAPQTLKNMVILCFERRFSKQNSVIRLKSNILAPKFFALPQIFGLATPL